jgi:hypothetical protein
VGVTSRVCSYTRPRPCTDEPGATVDVPTAGLADGPHTLAVAAFDAAGNESIRVTRSTPIKVDNDAPAAAVGLASPTPTSQTNSFAATWSLPADTGTPITEARYQLCQSGTCGAVQSSPALTSISGLSLAGPGAATLRVWLVDARGHERASSAAMTTLTYNPVVEQPTTTTLATPVTGNTTNTLTAPPPSSTTPSGTRQPVVRASANLKLTTLRRTLRAVTLAGTLSPKASGTVTIGYRVRLHRRTRRLTTRVRIRGHAFRATLKLSARYAAARAGTVSVAYAGDADTLPQTRVAALRLKR